MTTTNTYLVATFDAAQKDINNKLADSDATIALAEASIAQYRQAGKNVVLHDVLYARSRNIETHIWTVHSRINTLYRKQLVLHRRNNANAVELKLFVKQYLCFLKDSQRYYSQFIHDLNVAYGAIAELRSIAQLDSLAAVPNNDVSSEIKNESLISCYQSLIYLGDLSRYRATERLDTRVDWSHAKCYYTIAAQLRPSAGMAYHQLSVVALEQEDHLEAIYYLYSAICVDEPHPNASSNLDLEYRKVRKAFKCGALIPDVTQSDSHEDRQDLLSAWFVRMHSVMDRPQERLARQQSEQELFSRLNACLDLDVNLTRLTRMCHISFAAQHTAADRLQTDGAASHGFETYYTALHYNLRMFIALLGKLKASLNSMTDEPRAHGSDSTRASWPNWVSAARILATHLPCLRLFTAWLLTNEKVLSPGLGQKDLEEDMAQFWARFAEAMTLLSARFPVQELPEVTYQLVEDVASLGFLPLQSTRTMQRWYLAGSSQQIRKRDDVGVQKLGEDQEALGRIRGLLVDALMLAIDQDDPLGFDGSKFYVRREFPHSQSAQPAARSAGVTGTSVLQHEHEAVRRMSEMVDQLVDEDDNTIARLQIPRVMPSQRLSVASFDDSPPRSMSTDSARRMQSISGLWAPQSPLQSTSLLQQSQKAHTRVNSAISLASGGSGATPPISSSFAPTLPTQRTLSRGAVANAHTRNNSRQGAESPYDAGMNSPLLFGTGSVWSAKPRKSVFDVTPPSGQGIG